MCRKGGDDSVVSWFAAIQVRENRNWVSFIIRVQHLCYFRDRGSLASCWYGPAPGAGKQTPSYPSPPFRFANNFAMMNHRSVCVNMILLWPFCNVTLARGRVKSACQEGGVFHACVLTRSVICSNLASQMLLVMLKKYMYYLSIRSLSGGPAVWMTTPALPWPLPLALFYTLIVLLEFYKSTFNLLTFDQTHQYLRHQIIRICFD